MAHKMESKGFHKVIALCLVAFLSLGSMIPINTVSVQAATVEEEQDKVDDLKGEKDELESKVAEIGEKISEEEQRQEEYLKKITEAREQIESYQGDINVVNDEIEELNGKIDDLNKQIEDANQKIEQKKKEIAQKEAEIEAANEKFKDRLAAMYMTSGDLTVLSVLLGAESFSDFLTHTQILKNISDNDIDLMEQLEAYKTELQQLKAELEDFKAGLEEKKEQVEATKQEVEGKKQKLVSLQNAERAKEGEMSALRDESLKIIGQNRAAQSANADELARIESEIEEAEANISELIRQAEEDRNNQSDGGTPPPPSSSGWTHPCPGYSYISSYFGPREQPLPGASTNHGALDFAAGSGTSIYASRSGTVVDAIWGWGGGYGNHLLISHGDGYYTLYAHCSSLLVSSGTTVSQGQLIAKVGSTGNSTGPHLHFEVRYGGSKIDPLQFL